MRSGGITWPPATALDFTLMTISSNWLRLISTPFPLATNVSAKRSEIRVGLLDAGPFVESAALSDAAATSSRIIIVCFIYNGANLYVKLSFDQFATNRV